MNLALWFTVFAYVAALAVLAIVLRDGRDSL